MVKIKVLSYKLRNGENSELVLVLSINDIMERVAFIEVNYKHTSEFL